MSQSALVIRNNIALFGHAWRSMTLEPFKVEQVLCTYLRSEQATVQPVALYQKKPHCWSGLLDLCAALAVPR